MKYLKIQNNGELDIRLVALMGGTTKHNKYKIGQFGTGLKYTLAYLYRNNIDFKIYSGETAVNLSTEVERINDNDFEIICINGNRTSITTQMGQQWTAWMILRELWCNALDEGGQLKEVINGIGNEDTNYGEAGKTTFYVQLTPEIQAALDNWGNYFIQNREPISDNPEYGVYTNKDDGNLRLYKNGVLIYEHPNIKSLFYYDIKGADINELREFRGSVNYEVFAALSNPGEEAISYFLQNVKEEHYEGSELDFDWFQSFGKIWKNALGDNRIARAGDRSYYSEAGVEIDFTNVVELPKKVYTALVKQFEGIGVLGMSDDKTEFYETQDTVLREIVSQALSFLEDAKYKLGEGVEIRYGIFREPKKKAAANRNKKIIMISEVCKKVEPRELVNIIVENNEYIITNLNYDSFEWRRHFVNMFTGAIMPGL